MPLSTMSAASSGGVRSRAILRASTIALTGSCSASRISSSEIVWCRDAGDQVAALDLHRLLGLEREGRADLDLDLLGGALADQQVVLALDVLDDRLVHLVAGDADRLGVDDAGERDHRDLGRAAADVDDHVAGRLLDRQPGADRRRHRLLDQVDLARARGLRRVAHRALLDLGDARGHADDDARADQGLAVVHLLDEVAQHLLGDLEVGDHAVLQRPDGDDVPGRAPEHVLGLLADREHAVRVLVDGDDRGLVQDDALALDVDQGVRRAQVDGQVVGEQPPDCIEHHRSLISRVHVSRSGVRRRLQQSRTARGGDAAPEQPGRPGDAREVAERRRRRSAPAPPGAAKARRRSSCSAAGMNRSQAGSTPPPMTIRSGLSRFTSVENAMPSERPGLAVGLPRVGVPLERPAVHLLGAHGLLDRRASSR